MPEEICLSAITDVGRCRPKQVSPTAGAQLATSSDESVLFRDSQNMHELMVQLANPDYS
jgi:hypothetical protein